MSTTKPYRIEIHAPHLSPMPVPPRPTEPPATPVTQVLRQLIFKTLGFPDGPKLWAELHRRALAHDGSNDAAWLSAFEARILGNCSCRSQWKQDLIANPPRYGDYFAWTVEQHNAVNARLGKPTIGLSEARELWSQPLP